MGRDTMKLLLCFLGNLAGYILIYVTYSASSKTMTGRVIWTAAILAGTLIGSTLGNRWFK